jgi:AcrR family transcriptional regulator
MILAAATEQLATSGFQDFNMPALARKAGVALRTLYRYFPTKDALVDDLAVWLDDQISVRPPGRPITAETLARSAEATFPQFDENEMVLLAQWATRAGRALRERGRERRREIYRAALEEVTCNLSKAEARDALAVIGYLLSSWTWKTFREEYGMTGVQSGKAVSWAINTLVADLRRRNDERASRSTDGAGK